MNQCVKIQITGRVQGVWFRKSAQGMARKLNVVGYAKNNADGTVTIEACGNKKALTQMIDWCKKGSRLARVDDIRYTYGEKEQTHNDFCIL